MNNSINKLFHKAAREGRAIYQLRMRFFERGKKLSAYRIDLLIKLRKLKRNYNKSLNKIVNNKKQ